MRSTVFGKEVSRRSGAVIGINIGYNYIHEHNEGVIGTIQYLNSADYFGDPAKERKEYLEGMRMLKRVKVPFGFSEYRLRPNTPYIKRNIIIDNSPIKSNWSNFVMEDGNWCAYIFDKEPYLRDWRSRLGKKRKFTEQDFSRMQDYQCIDPRGFQSIGIHGGWSLRGGLLVLVRKDSLYSDCIVDQIEISLKSGNLGICDGRCGLFKDRGLSLVFLDKVKELM